MSDSISIVNLDGLAKPVNTLIEKISNAIGEIFKPYQIARVAQAEAKAEKIRAVSRIRITDLQRRAVHRFFAEEATRQKNIECITNKALPQVIEEARPDQVEDDWITNFFDKCRLISDEQMQGLWAKILAGEANAPGKFSKRTVNLVASLDKADAAGFTKLCGFGCHIKEEFILLVYNTVHSIYTNNGASFMAVSHLESIGLVRFDNLGGHILNDLTQKEPLDFFGKKIWIDFRKAENKEFRIGLVLLTQAGQQLAPVCSAQPQEGFVDYVKAQWKGFGYQIEGEAEPSAAADGISAAAKV